MCLVMDIFSFNIFYSSLMFQQVFPNFNKVTPLQKNLNGAVIQVFKVCDREYQVGLKDLHGFEFPSAAPRPPAVCLTAIFAKIGRNLSTTYVHYLMSVSFFFSSC